MGQVFEVSLSNWKQAFETYQEELKEQRGKRPASNIHKATHEYFKHQARDLIVRQQGRAAE